MPFRSCLPAVFAVVSVQANEQSLAQIACLVQAKGSFSQGSRLRLPMLAAASAGSIRPGPSQPKRIVDIQGVLPLSFRGEDCQTSMSTSAETPESEKRSPHDLLYRVTRGHSASFASGNACVLDTSPPQRSPRTALNPCRLFPAMTFPHSSAPVPRSLRFLRLS